MNITVYSTARPAKLQKASGFLILKSTTCELVRYFYGSAVYLQDYFMLNEEVKPRLNSMADDAMKAPCNKQKEREELELLTKQFLRKGKINELPPSLERADTLLF